MSSPESRPVSKRHSGQRTLAPGMRKERAFLVGLDYRKRRASGKGLTPGAQAARDVSLAKTKPTSDPQFTAEESLGLTQKGYQAGELAFLNLLDAQRTYFRTNLQYLETLRELRTTTAEIEGLLLRDSLGANP